RQLSVAPDEQAIFHTRQLAPPSWAQQPDLASMLGPPAAVPVARTVDGQRDDGRVPVHVRPEQFPRVPALARAGPLLFHFEDESRGRRVATEARDLARPGVTGFS